MEPLKEVIRFLMGQVREEQRARQELLQGKKDRTPVKQVTDSEVESRIEEIEDLLEKPLTKYRRRGRM